MQESNYNIDDFINNDISDNVLAEIFQIREEIDRARLLLDNEDIRITFYEHSINFLNRYQIQIDSLNSDVHEKQWQKAFRITGHLNDDFIFNHKLNLFHMMNSDLIIKYWSSFEHTIDILSEYTLSEEDKYKLRKRHYSTVINLIEKSGIEINEELDSNLSTLITSNYQLVASMTKIEKLLREIKNQLGDDLYIEYHHFLVNFAKIRNAMHANFIYSGKNQDSFVFDGIEFHFDPGECIIMKPYNTNTSFKLVRHLRVIYKAIIDNVNCDVFLKDPTIDYNSRY